MLLRRLTDHVSEQNWTAVALDFGIVLVGVLLAFQINAWNENRMERAEQKAALERLLSESEEAITYLQRSIDRSGSTTSHRVESSGLCIEQVAETPNVLGDAHRLSEPST